MPEQASFQCPRCQQMRLFTRNGVNHILHLLISLFLCGMWIPFWILISIGNDNNPYFCSTCGYANSPGILANPMQAEQRRIARELKRNTPSYWQTTYFPFIKSKYNESPVFFIFAGIMIVLIGTVSFALLYELTRQPGQPPIVTKPRSPQAAAPNQTVGSPENTAGKITQKPKPKLPLKTKSAIVISENTILRKAADQNAFVIETLPNGASVRVINQNGAWFYVNYLGQEGWLPGNTIKLVESN